MDVLLLICLVKIPVEQHCVGVDVLLYGINVFSASRRMAQSMLSVGSLIALWKLSLLILPLTFFNISLMLNVLLVVFRTYLIIATTPTAFIKKLQKNLPLF